MQHNKILRQPTYLKYCTQSKLPWNQDNKDLSDFDSFISGRQATEFDETGAPRVSLASTATTSNAPANGDLPPVDGLAAAISTSKRSRKISKSTTKKGKGKGKKPTKGTGYDAASALIDSNLVAVHVLDVCQNRRSSSEPRPSRDDGAVMGRSFWSQTQSHANILSSSLAKGGKSRIFWNLVVGLAITGLVFELFQVTQRYIRSPTASEIEIESVGALRFPETIICPLNPLNRTYLQLNNISEKLGYYAQHVFMTTKNDAYSTPLNITAELGLREELDHLLDRYKDRDLRNFFLEAGFTCSSFLLQCSFQWSPFDCCDYAQPILDIHFGKCFLLRGNFIQQYPAAGLQAKIMLHRDLSVLKYGSPAYGIALRLHGRYDPSDTEYTYINRGKHVAVQIEETNQHFLNTIFDTVCTETTSKNWSTITTSNYTKNQCIAVCFNAEAIHRCNCTYPQDQSLFGGNSSVYRMCTPWEVVNCLIEEVEVSNAVAACTTSCMPECDQLHYKISVSAADLLDHSHQYTEDVSNMIILDVFFTKIQRTNIREIYIITADTLISQIGGLLGIFLGASLITAVQIAIFCIGLLVRKTKAMKERWHYRRIRKMMPPIQQQVMPGPGRRYARPRPSTRRTEPGSTTSTLVTATPEPNGKVVTVTNQTTVFGALAENEITI